jgi:hypothetical protein
MPVTFDRRCAYPLRLVPWKALQRQLPVALDDGVGDEVEEGGSAVGEG